MKGDPSNPADWLRAARADVGRTRLMLAGGDPGGATFRTQQAAEKALKGWLIGKGWVLVKTHDPSHKLLVEVMTRFKQDHFEKMFTLLRLSPQSRVLLRG